MASRMLLIEAAESGGSDSGGLKSPQSRHRMEERHSMNPSMSSGSADRGSFRPAMKKGSSRRLSAPNFETNEASAPAPAPARTWAIADESRRNLMSGSIQEAEEGDL